MIVALEINWVNLLPRKSSISTQRIVNLEGVPRMLEIEGVIVKIVFERKSMKEMRITDLKARINTSGGGGRIVF